jgi:hypothetical protein
MDGIEADICFFTCVNKLHAQTRARA